MLSPRRGLSRRTPSSVRCRIGTCTRGIARATASAPSGSTAWTTAQAYSTSATFTWNTSGKAPGTYHYSVWVRDAGSSDLHVLNPETELDLGGDCRAVLEIDKEYPGIRSRRLPRPHRGCRRRCLRPSPTPGQPGLVGRPVCEHSSGRRPPRPPWSLLTTQKPCAPCDGDYRRTARTWSLSRLSRTRGRVSAPWSWCR